MYQSQVANNNSRTKEINFEQSAREVKTHGQEEKKARKESESVKVCLAVCCSGWGA